MSSGKEGIMRKKSPNAVNIGNKLFQVSHSSNKNLQVLDSFLHSSNKPGFIGCEINRGIDDELLKGGFRKI